MAGRRGRGGDSHDGDRDDADAAEWAYFDLELFLNAPAGEDIPVNQILDKIYRAPWREGQAEEPAGGLPASIVAASLAETPSLNMEPEAEPAGPVERPPNKRTLIVAAIIGVLLAAILVLLIAASAPRGVSGAEQGQQGAAVDLQGGRAR